MDRKSQERKDRSGFDDTEVFMVRDKPPLQDKIIIPSLHPYTHVSGFS